jgi:hypothetical protein
MLIVRSAHEELRRWLTEVIRLLPAGMTIIDSQWNKPDQTQPDGRQEYDNRAQFYFAYHSLVLYSFGLENAIEVSPSRGEPCDKLTGSAPRWTSRSSSPMYTRRPRCVRFSCP